MTFEFDDLAYEHVLEKYGHFVLIKVKNITWGGSSFELLSFSGNKSDYNEVIYKDISFYLIKELTMFFPYLQFDFKDDLIITTFC
jgi:hypothetical protein